MLRKDVVTNRVYVVSLPDTQFASVLLAQKAVRPDGKERTITQKVSVPDMNLLARINAEVTQGAEIEATIVTEWRKNGYTTYLADFHLVAVSSSTVSSAQEEQPIPLMAKAS